jgi:hypothetical protein
MPQDTLFSRALVLVALLAGPWGPAQEAPKVEEASPPAASGPWKGRVEIKREETDKGTEGESSKTNLRVEYYPGNALLALLRVDLPFPDAKPNDSEGKSFDFRQGDLRVRAGFRPFPAGRLSVRSFLEATFPTADPSDLGSGKYQVSGGLGTVHRLPFALGQAHQATFEPLLQQVVSVAGDPARKDINYTRLELNFRDAWERKWLLLNFKPEVDWVDGKTGAVAELEFGFGFGRGWSAWLVVGGQVWGEGVAGSYRTRVTFGLARMF